MANILIVEDDLYLRDFLAVALREHKITMASDGEEAFRLLGVQPEDDSAPLPDLIIMDIMMPKVDGLSTVQQLSANSRTRSVPVIIVTAKHRMREVMMGCSNVVGFLDKPFGEKELRTMAAGVLQRPGS